MILLVKSVSLMATHWRFMEGAFGSGVSMRRRAASCAAAKTVRNIDVVRRRQTTSTHSLPGVRLTARSFAPTHMHGQLRSVRLAAPISANGAEDPKSCGSVESPPEKGTDQVVCFLAAEGVQQGGSRLCAVARSRYCEALSNAFRWGFGPPQGRLRRYYERTYSEHRSEI